MTRPFIGDHGISEVIDALYRESAVPRDHARLIALVKEQVRHAHYLGYRAGYSNALNTRARALGEDAI
jgi:hypothetical protein